MPNGSRNRIYSLEGCHTDLCVIGTYQDMILYKLTGGVDGCRPRWIPACKAGAFADSLRPHKLDAFLVFRSKLLSYKCFFWSIRQESNLRPKDYAICCLHLNVARVAGLEPATKWLTATYSTIEPYPNNTRHILNISFLSSLNIQWTLFPRALELQLGTYII